MLHARSYDCKLYASGGLVRVLDKNEKGVIFIAPTRGARIIDEQTGRPLRKKGEYKYINEQWVREIRCGNVLCLLPDYLIEKEEASEGAACKSSRSDKKW